MNGYIQYVFPIVKDMGKMTKADFANEVFGALTLLAVVLPQSMAYSTLTGISPVYGLYSSTIPVIFYSLIASSKHTVTGTFALTSIILRSCVDFVLAIPELNLNEEFRVQIALLISLVSAVFQVILGMTLGNVISKHLLPDCLISGISAGAGLHIMKSQLGSFLGFKVPGYNNLSLFRSAFYVITNLNHIHIPTVLVAFITIVLSSLFKMIHNKLPQVLLAVLLSSVFSFFYNSSALATSFGSIETVGFIPRGIPNFQGFPNLPRDKISLIVGFSVYPSIKLSLVSSVMTVAISLLYAKKLNYVAEISTKREIVALGLSSIIGTLFVGSFISCGSLSRTALAVQADIKSQLANIISGILVLISLLFLTDILSFIPTPTLAAVVLLAVISLILLIFDGTSLLRYGFSKSHSFDWEIKIKRFEAFIWWSSFLSTIFFDIDIGLWVGIGICLLFLMFKSTIPSLSEIVCYTTEEDDILFAPLVRKNIFNRPNKRTVGDFSQDSIYSQISYDDLKPFCLSSPNRLPGILSYKYHSPYLFMNLKILKILINSHLKYWKHLGASIVVIDVRGEISNSTQAGLLDISKEVSDPVLMFVNPEFQMSRADEGEYGSLLQTSHLHLFKNFHEAINTAKKILPQKENMRRLELT